MSFSLYHPDSLIGRVIAGYELTDFIDSGASSLVFRGKRVAGAPEPAKETRALPVTIPDVAAIKLLAPSLGATEEEAADFQRRFEREASVLKQLAHPHILAVIDSGKDADTGYFYMVLPFMEGGSLASALARRGPPPLSEVAALLTQIASALDFAHRHGIIHRDVKPGNILLDAQDAPYLGDFGIVRLLENNTTQRTTIGRVMGSPAYLAPEQFNDPSRIGPVSDIYSLGMVVYQMVTGHVAFQTTSWPALIHQQLNEAPTSPRSARPDLPEPAGAAILHALEKDPTHRFPTAAAFAEAFALGAQGRWADGLMEYMAAATMPATTITTPLALAAAPVAPALTPQGAARTWPNAAATGGWPGSRWRGGRGRGARSVGVAAAALLLVSCLVGIIYLGASGSAQDPQSQATFSAGSSAKTATPTSTSPPQPPRPTATKTPSDNGSGGAAPVPTATNTPTPLPSSTPLPLPTATGAPIPATPSPTPTDTPTPAPPSPTPTNIPTPALPTSTPMDTSSTFWFSINASTHQRIRAGNDSAENASRSGQRGLLEWSRPNGRRASGKAGVFGDVGEERAPAWLPLGATHWRLRWAADTRQASLCGASGNANSGSARGFTLACG